MSNSNDKAMVKRDETAVARQDAALAIERLVVMGDLSQLTPEQRVAHYKATCQAVGVDWIARPFDYILVDAGGGQKKLVLYANQNCATQLRDARDVNCRITSREKTGDLYIVTAEASLRNGRSEEATGAVAIAVELGEWRTAESGKKFWRGTGEYKELRGTELANCLMKAETKAKRRATLALCGLGGWADEPQGEALDVDIRTGKENEPDPRDQAYPVQQRAASKRYHTIPDGDIVLPSGRVFMAAEDRVVVEEPAETEPQREDAEDVDDSLVGLIQRLHATQQPKWSQNQRSAALKSVGIVLLNAGWDTDQIKAALCWAHREVSGELLSLVDAKANVGNNVLSALKNLSDEDTTALREQADAWVAGLKEARGHDWAT